MGRPPNRPCHAPERSARVAPGAGGARRRHGPRGDRDAGVASRGPRAKARGATRQNCNPPFYFDKAGNRVFKTECL